MSGALFELKIEGLEALERDLERAFQHVGNGVRKAVRVAAIEGADEARTKHRYKDRTGTLTRSIRPVPQFDATGKAEALIVADAPYAAYVEEGTPAHEIRPKAGHGSIGPLLAGQSRRGKKDIGTHRVALRFPGPGGQFIFRRVVHHPGSKPYPFMGIAYLKAEAVLRREIEVAIDEAFKNFR